MGGSLRTKSPNPSQPLVRIRKFDQEPALEVPHRTCSTPLDLTALRTGSNVEVEDLHRRKTPECVKSHQLLKVEADPEHSSIENWSIIMYIVLKQIPEL